MSAQNLKLSFRSYHHETDSHSHRHAQLVLPLAGRLEIEIGGRGGWVHHACAAFVPPGVTHAQSGRGENLFLVVDLDSETLEGAHIEQMAQLIYVPVSPAARRLIEFAETSRHGGQWGEALARNWVPLLFDTLLLDLRRPASRLAGLLAAIEAQLDYAWTTSEMAMRCGISVSQLHQLFQKELAQSPAAYLAARRIGRACEELAWTSESIAEIACRVGYSDQTALTRAMRQATGTTPAAWRRSSHAVAGKP
ncbi:helix-turn-helix transcriptional regulator [Gluconacetobacter azotocaptans]|uniref:Helix-turn-helix transcriptional regulator n=1 Tax=Gluconacetobacter azotocaptans TaxID=142834 RepID=A0A7W4PFP8_9PROT|nr:AraC family transcriptional regulator [Gluconacetobacter azotocaptans]MBB2190799.1 helix-turn-helix transcriptional regulator [Gluconacetobacter azotocaptans]MBM9400755.1 helix-turn-helix domain-containing protein [Gluconacetobacter azotocaptans]GBQ30818.1 AraC family transcriptional regulator [Gluconacetobacter azotocaptans DSM 13594]